MIKTLQDLGDYMGPIGVPEMAAIFVIALLLFGPKKLPELGKTLGKALSEFRRAKNELKSTFESHMQELERETRMEAQQKSLSSSTPHADYSSASYPHPYDETGPYEPPVGSSVQAAPMHHTLEQAAVPSAEPVDGVVPRSNGFHSISSHSTVEQEEHSA